MALYRCVSLRCNRRANSPEEVLGLFRNLFGANAVSPEVEELNVMLDAATAEPDAIKRVTELYTLRLKTTSSIVPWRYRLRGEVRRSGRWYQGVDRWLRADRQYVPLNLSGVTVDTTHPDYPADRPYN